MLAALTLTPHTPHICAHTTQALSKDPLSKSTMAAAAGAELLDFDTMTEDELRQWVDASPSRVNDWDWDEDGITPLFTAVYHMKSFPLVLWLLDEKGADVNMRVVNGQTPLHGARSLDVLSALLDRGANPTLPDDNNWCPLMCLAYYGGVDMVARLLQVRSVRNTVDEQESSGWTAFHFACFRMDDETLTASIVQLLLQAGANPNFIDQNQDTHFDLLLHYYPDDTTTIALLNQALAAAEVTARPVKARRLVVATTTSATLFYLQNRVAQVSVCLGWCYRGHHCRAK